MNITLKRVIGSLHLLQLSRSYANAAISVWICGCNTSQASGWMGLYLVRYWQQAISLHKYNVHHNCLQSTALHSILQLQALFLHIAFLHWLTTTNLTDSSYSCSLPFSLAVGLSLASRIIIRVICFRFGSLKTKQLGNLTMHHCILHVLWQQYHLPSIMEQRLRCDSS